MRNIRLLLATTALVTLGASACKPRVVHGNTKRPMYPADAGLGDGSGAAEPDANTTTVQPPAEK